MVCCVHGRRCSYGKGNQDGKRDDNQYVNLPFLKNQDQIASKLTGKLNKLKIAEEKENKIVPREKPEMMSLNTLVEIARAGEQPRKGRGDKEKRTKKAPVLVDDSQLYVMIGPPRFIFQLYLHRECLKFQ